MRPLNAPAALSACRATTRIAGGFGVFKDLHEPRGAAQGDADGGISWHNCEIRVGAGITDEQVCVEGWDGEVRVWYVHLV
jgi:hypothetical protein